ncbi:MAG: pilus assembly protein [Acidimicrobiia bacterium]|nr:pilus assembly protein [Acidimicrobiia bacterium]
MTPPTSVPTSESIRAERSCAVITRRRSDDRGSVIVEAALALPILVILMLGLLDMGFLWRQSNVTQTAAGSAGRVAATTGAYRYADFEALRAVDAALSGIGRVEIQRVIIYNANFGNEPPGSCLAIAVSPTDTSTKGVGGVCNVYSQAQVQQENAGVGFGSPSAVDPTCSPGSWDSNWCPSSRNAPTPGQQPDWVGVFIELEYEPLTGALGAGEFTYSRTAVFQVEPCIDGLSLYDCPL